MDIWPYTYFAAVQRVVDGDTYDLEIDLGFRSRVDMRVRLWGVNTPEVRGPDRERGLAATQFVRDTLASCHPRIIVTTEREAGGFDNFGRYLASVIVFERSWDGHRGSQSGMDLGTLIVSAGHGEWYRRSE